MKIKDLKDRIKDIPDEYDIEFVTKKFSDPGPGEIYLGTPSPVIEHIPDYDINMFKNDNTLTFRIGITI